MTDDDVERFRRAVNDVAEANRATLAETVGPLRPDPDFDQIGAIVLAIWQVVAATRTKEEVGRSPMAENRPDAPNIPALPYEVVEAQDRFSAEQLTDTSCTVTWRISARSGEVLFEHERVAVVHHSDDGGQL